MDDLSVDAIELCGPAHIEFAPNGHGQFNFIAVEASLDWKPDDGVTVERVAFSWEGEDEGDAKCGRGWAAVNDDGDLVGRIFFHHGDDTSFRAARVPNAVHKD